MRYEKNSSVSVFGFGDSEELVWFELFVFVAIKGVCVCRDKECLDAHKFNFFLKARSVQSDYGPAEILEGVINEVLYFQP